MGIPLVERENLLFSRATQDHGGSLDQNTYPTNLRFSNDSKIRKMIVL